MVILSSHSLVLTKWSKSKIKWCSSERQFKHIPSSTYLNSSERRALDLNGWGPGFNAPWSNILLMEFLLSLIEASDANIAITTNSLCLKNLTVVWPCKCEEEQVKKSQPLVLMSGEGSKISWGWISLFFYTGRMSIQMLQLQTRQCSSSGRPSYNCQ